MTKTKTKRKSEKKNEPAKSTGPQAHGPKRSGSTFRRHCIKGSAPSQKVRRRTRGSVAAMMTMMIRVVAGIIEQEGRVLICQRRAGGILAGKWEFPGGKMRPSETPRQALDASCARNWAVPRRAEIYCKWCGIATRR